MLSKRVKSAIDEMIITLPKNELENVFDDFLTIFNALPEDIEGDALEMMDYCIQGVKARIEDDI